MMLIMIMMFLLLMMIMMMMILFLSKGTIFVCFSENYSVITSLYFIVYTSTVCIIYDVCIIYGVVYHELWMVYNVWKLIQCIILMLYYYYYYGCLHSLSLLCSILCSFVVASVLIIWYFVHIVYTLCLFLQYLCLILNGRQ
jgi:hypothetical protein